MSKIGRERERKEERFLLCAAQSSVCIEMLIFKSIIIRMDGKGSIAS